MVLKKACADHTEARNVISAESVSNLQHPSLSCNSTRVFLRLSSLSFYRRAFSSLTSEAPDPPLAYSFLKRLFSKTFHHTSLNSLGAGITAHTTSITVVAECLWHHCRYLTTKKNLSSFPSAAACTVTQALWRSFMNCRIKSATTKKKTLISHAPFVTSWRFWEVSKLNLTVEHRVNLKPSSVLSHSLPPIRCTLIQGLNRKCFGWRHMLCVKGQGTQGAEITLLPASPHSFSLNSLRWKPLSRCRMSCTEQWGPIRPQRWVERAQPHKECLALLFRKENRKTVRKTYFSTTIC